MWTGSSRPWSCPPRSSRAGRRCCPAPRRSSRRAAPPASCTTSPGPAHGLQAAGPVLSSGGPFFVSCVLSGGAINGGVQPFPLLVDPLTLRVVLQKRLRELHRVLPDDLADRGSIRRALLEEIGKVLEHRHEGLPSRYRPEVHQVPLQRLDRRAIVRGQLFCARLVLPVALLLLERPCDLLDPPRCHVYFSPSWSCSSRSARKLHVL